MASFGAMGLSRFGSMVGRGLSRSSSSASSISALSRQNSNASMISNVSALSRQSSNASVASRFSQNGARFPVSRMAPAHQPQLNPAMPSIAPQSAQVRGGLQRSNAFRAKRNGGSPVNQPPAYSPQGTSGNISHAGSPVAPPPRPPKEPIYQSASEQYNLRHHLPLSNTPPTTRTYNPYQPSMGHITPPQNVKPYTPSSGGNVGGYGASYSSSAGLPSTGGTGAYQAHRPYSPANSGTPGGGGYSAPSGQPVYQSPSEIHNANNPRIYRSKPQNFHAPKPVSGNYSGSYNGAKEQFTPTQTNGAGIRGTVTQWESKLSQNPDFY